MGIPKGYVARDRAKRLLLRGQNSKRVGWIWTGAYWDGLDSKSYISRMAPCIGGKNFYHANRASNLALVVKATPLVPSIILHPSIIIVRKTIWTCSGLKGVTSATIILSHKFATVTRVHMEIIPHRFLCSAHDNNIGKTQDWEEPRSWFGSDPWPIGLTYLVDSVPASAY